MMPVTGSNTGFKEKILSIRVSADGLCFWTEDYMFPGQELGDGMPSAVVPESSGQCDNIVFDAGVPLEENLHDAVGRIKESCFPGGQPGFGRICVYPDTIKTILIPEEVYTAGCEKEYIGLHNYTMEHDEKVDVSKPVCGTVAVIISPENILRVLGESLGEFSVASLSQYNMLVAAAKAGSKRPGQDDVLVYLSVRYMYISVFNRNGANAFPVLAYNNTVPYKTPDDILFHLDWVYNNITGNKPVSCIRGEFTGDVREFLKKYFKGNVCA